MTAFERFVRELASHLRSQGHHEGAVAEMVAEIMSDPRINHKDPQISLGPAKDLAASYGKGPNRSAGFTVISVAAILAFAIGTAKLISSQVLGLQTSLALTCVIYGIAVAIFVVGVAVGSTLDRRLPKSLVGHIRQPAARP